MSHSTIDVNAVLKSNVTLTYHIPWYVKFMSSTTPPVKCVFRIFWTLTKTHELASSFCQLSETSSLENRMLNSCSVSFSCSKTLSAPNRSSGAASMGWILFTVPHVPKSHSVIHVNLAPFLIRKRARERAVHAKKDGREAEREHSPLTCMYRPLVQTTPSSASTAS